MLPCIRSALHLPSVPEGEVNLEQSVELAVSLLQIEGALGVSLADVLLFELPGLAVEVEDIRAVQGVSAALAAGLTALPELL